MSDKEVIEFMDGLFAKKRSQKAIDRLFRAITWRRGKEVKRGSVSKRRAPRKGNGT